MNPMNSHPMSMDRMIFDFDASVYATSLYILLCSHLDEGENPTLELARRAWNASEEDLVQAARELIDRKVIKPMDPLDFDSPLLLNPRENWFWCKPGSHNGVHAA